MGKKPSMPVTFGPEHSVCETQVEIPTIRLVKNGEMICVQWKGQPYGELPPNVIIPSGAQFLFPLLIPPNNVRFYASTEACLVPFLGQVKNWPAPEQTVQRMIETVGEGSPDNWMVWFLNPRVQVQNDRIQSEGRLIAILGDPNCGVIVPELFSDLTVRDRALELFKG